MGGRAQATPTRRSVRRCCDWGFAHSRAPAVGISLWHRSGVSGHRPARAAVGDSVERGAAFSMTFLPIVERELRVAARRKNTFWTRMAVALGAVLIAGWALLTTRFLPVPVNAGTMLFSSLSGLAFVYCLLGGILKTTDCLSEEKREGTLGLLFLTDLSGHDVVLGKMAATSLNWSYGLLAAFPILATSLLLGGVTVGEFWRTILALVNLLFVALAAGMFVSSISRHERKAVVGTVL